MNKMTLLLATAAAIGFAAPALASETVSVDFTVPNGGQSVGLYFGQVQVNVVGTGESLGSLDNDAFYVFEGGVFHDANYYQLTYGLSPLVPLNSAQNAVNFIVGGLPAYSPTHEYNFVLNTGAAVGSILHFGVSDGNFGDNKGSYRVTITQLGSVPEPASWAMMIGGFALAGSVMRRKKAAVSFA